MIFPVLVGNNESLTRSEAVVLQMEASRSSGCCYHGLEEYLDQSGSSSYGCATPCILCSGSPEL